MMKAEAVCTCRPGVTIWLNGLPGSGKTTIARTLAGRLHAARRPVEVLDHDAISRFLPAALGATRGLRDEGVRRIGLVAEVLARNGTAVLVPVTTTYTDGRDAVRERHERSGTPYLEVHVATPAAGTAHESATPPGADDPCEASRTPDLWLQTLERTADDCAEAVYELLVGRGLA